MAEGGRPWDLEGRWLMEVRAGVWLLGAVEGGGEEVERSRWWLLLLTILIDKRLGQRVPGARGLLAVGEVEKRKGKNSRVRPWRFGGICWYWKYRLCSGSLWFFLTENFET